MGRQLRRRCGERSNARMLRVSPLSLHCRGDAHLKLVAIGLGRRCVSRCRLSMYMLMYIKASLGFFLSGTTVQTDAFRSSTRTTEIA